MLLGIFAIAAVAFLAWLLFTFAVYAMPLMIGVTAGIAAYHTGSGMLGALVVGVVVAALVVAFGELAFAKLRSPIARTLLALAYAGPAAVAGFHAVHGIAKLSVPSPTWLIAFSVAGGVATGAIALARLTSAPRVAGRGVALPSDHAGSGSEFRTGRASHAASKERKLSIGQY